MQHMQHVCSAVHLLNFQSQGEYAGSQWSRGRRSCVWRRA